MRNTFTVMLLLITVLILQSCKKIKNDENLLKENIAEQVFLTDKGIVVNKDENKLNPVKSVNEYEALEYIPATLLNELGPQLKEYAEKIYGENYLNVLEHIENNNSSQSNIEDVIFVQMKIYGYRFVYGVSMNDILPSALNSERFPVVNASSQCDCKSEGSKSTAKNVFGAKICFENSCTINGNILYNGENYEF